MKTFFRRNLLALILTALGISLYFSLSILFFADSQYYESNLGGLEEAAEALASSLPEGMLRSFFEGNGEEAAAWIAGARRNGPYRLTLIRPDGTVLADSDMDAAGAVNHGGREEVRAALAGRNGVARRNSTSLGMEFLYAALPVYGSGGEAAGVFRLSRTTPSFWRRLSGGVAPFLGLGVLVILGIFGALYAFSRSLARPLAELASAARSYHSQGETGTAPKTAAYGIREFDLLDEALRSMAGELKARLAEAQAEGRRLEAILRGMDEAVLALDGNLQLDLINPKARSLLGIDPAAGPEGGSLLEAGGQSVLEEAARTVLAEKKALEREIRLFAAGKSRHIRLFASPLEDGGVVMVLGDLTRLHKLERVRRDFVANVSHELRTPIQLIKGYAETLEAVPQEGDAWLEAFRRAMGIIRKNALNMENLTGDLLTLAGLEEEEQRLPEMSAVHIRALLDEAVGSVEAGAAKKNIRITQQCEADLTAWVHEALMVQALVNLLDNAVKYSPPGSEVRVEAQQAGEELVIAVKDQGIGIGAEHQGRIFERFYRVDKSRSRAEGGTGLGLAIVRHIVLLHRGVVEVESHAGEGSVFRIRLRRTACPSSPLLS